jgi:hypothetical protein
MSRIYFGTAALGGLWGIISTFLLNGTALHISTGATGSVVFVASLWGALATDHHERH